MSLPWCTEGTVSLGSRRVKSTAGEGKAIAVKVGTSQMWVLLVSAQSQVCQESRAGNVQLLPCLCTPWDQTTPTGVTALQKPSCSPTNAAWAVAGFTCWSSSLTNVNSSLAFTHPAGAQETIANLVWVCSVFNSFLAALTPPCRDRKDRAGAGLTRQIQGPDAESFLGSHVNICPCYRLSQLTSHTGCIFPRRKTPGTSLYRMCCMAQDTSGDLKCNLSILSSILLLFLGTIFQRPGHSGLSFLEKEWRNRPGRWWGKNR